MVKANLQNARDALMKGFFEAEVALDNLKEIVTTDYVTHFTEAEKQTMKDELKQLSKVYDHLQESYEKFYSLRNAYNAKVS